VVEDWFSRYAERMAASEKDGPRRNGRNGNKLSIPLPFDEALKAATETKPPKEPEKAPAKKPAKR